MKKRFSAYGLKVGNLASGQKNSIADVEGVRVGHCTKIEGDDIRTGVTVIDPGVQNLYNKKIPAAVAVGNGVGKVAGFTQVEETGTLEAPIALTSTLAVGPVMRGVVDLILETTRDIGPLDSVNAVVGECNDGFLNDIHHDVITKDDVRKAFDARTDNFEIGNVGAGTGMRAFGFKGGIGTASHEVMVEGKIYTLGVLVQTNFGGNLTILGVPVYRFLKKPDPPHLPITTSSPSRGEDLGEGAAEEKISRDGSCMIVIATDAPLTARQLKRITNRTFLGLGRTGSVMRHASGDYAIAFSTNRTGLEGSGEIGQCLADNLLTPFFVATVDGTEEAIYDALFAAETMRGTKGAVTVLEALPHDEVVDLLRRYTPSPSDGRG